MGCFCTGENIVSTSYAQDFPLLLIEVLLKVNYISSNNHDWVLVTLHAESFNLKLACFKTNTGSNLYSPNEL